MLQKNYENVKISFDAHTCPLLHIDSGQIELVRVQNVLRVHRSKSAQSWKKHTNKWN